ncbi:hypothetical protein SUGI_0886280 [Cryptomeria japonica]|nr:hypothetical protein SUGI_0886280 [Cryptomeria japonica]
MKRDNLITWLKILWMLLGFLLFPLLFTFLGVFHKPYFIIGYVVVMMAAIYVIFIREKEEKPVALPPRSVVMTVVNYRPGEKEEKRECVICLSEFEKEEELAQLGCCGSMFHRISAWKLAKLKSDEAMRAGSIYVAICWRVWNMQ